MGSFYVNCSITNQTIVDGQELYIQFMLPSNSVAVKDRLSLVEMFVNQFLQSVQKKGLDEAMKQFQDNTKTWNEEASSPPKGSKIESPIWVPFGPAIKAYYNDCCDVIPAEDEETQQRVKILEELMGLPFKTILAASIDDRWATLGITQNNSGWALEGLNSETPDFIITLCKNLSITYIHSKVYEKTADFNFPYDDYVDWKDEVLKDAKKYLNKGILAVEKLASTEKPNTPEEKMDKLDWDTGIIRLFSKVQTFRNISRELGLIYLGRLCALENKDLSWFYESLIFIYNLQSLGLRLNQSNYGTQEKNWNAWKIINSQLN